MIIARLVLLSALLFSAAAESGRDIVLPALADNLVCYYDFDHAVDADDSKESDLGFSDTVLQLVNGGALMRSDDAAYPDAGQSLQTQQVSPLELSNDDWKAGTYDAAGVATLRAFNGVAGITLMGWVKPTGSNPNLNSTTKVPDDYFGAVGLFGLLSGTSEGHLVRALLEVIQVDNELRLVALGRPDDSGNSRLLVADGGWQELVPPDTWTHLAATFDFDSGDMALYRNGVLQAASYNKDGDLWQLDGDPEPDLSSASTPTGIKIGGSYPQNTQERNPFNGRFDDLMFFDRALSDREVQAQFAQFHD